MSSLFWECMICSECITAKEAAQAKTSRSVEFKSKKGGKVEELPSFDFSHNVTPIMSLQCQHSLCCSCISRIKCALEDDEKTKNKKNLMCPYCKVEGAFRTDRMHPNEALLGMLAQAAEATEESLLRDGDSICNSSSSSSSSDAAPAVARMPTPAEKRAAEAAIHDYEHSQKKLVAPPAVARMPTPAEKRAAEAAIHDYERPKMELRERVAPPAVARMPTPAEKRAEATIHSASERSNLNERVRRKRHSPARDNNSNVAEDRKPRARNKPRSSRASTTSNGNKLNSNRSSVSRSRPARAAKRRAGERKNRGDKDDGKERAHGQQDASRRQDLSRAAVEHSRVLEVEVLSPFAETTRHATTFQLNKDKDSNTASDDDDESIMEVEGPSLLRVISVAMNKNDNGRETSERLDAESDGSGRANTNTLSSNRRGTRTMNPVDDKNKKRRNAALRSNNVEEGSTSSNSVVGPQQRVEDAPPPPTCVFPPPFTVHFSAPSSSSSNNASIAIPTEDTGASIARRTGEISVVLGSAETNPYSDSNGHDGHASASRLPSESSSKKSSSDDDDGDNDDDDDDVVEVVSPTRQREQLSKNNGATAQTAIDLASDNDDYDDDYDDRSSKPSTSALGLPPAANFPIVRLPVGSSPDNSGSIARVFRLPVVTPQSAADKSQSLPQSQLPAVSTRARLESRKGSSSDDDDGSSTAGTSIDTLSRKCSLARPHGRPSPSLLGIQRPHEMRRHIDPSQQMAR